ncbi:MAG: Hsp33 family molecular chaperone HslO [Pseudomonadota bacterium]
MTDAISDRKTGMDVLHRFSFDQLPVRGQWVRLHGVLADAFAHKTYPDQVRSLLGQMFAAVAMFADNLKFDGAVALQSKGGGAIRQTLAECREHQFIRGIAHLRDNFSIPTAAADLNAWLGAGAERGSQAQLALSLIPAAEAKQTTYQAFVPLNQASLAANLEDYFATSEQLPTRLFFTPADSSTDTVTGLLLQRLPSPDLASEVELASFDDAWETLETLANTLTMQELAALSARQLLSRLFAEFECRLHAGQVLSYRCTCSREKTDRTLGVFDPEELEEILAERGHIHVDCEFCGKRYEYDQVDVRQLAHGSPAGAGAGTQEGHEGPLH